LPEDSDGSRSRKSATVVWLLLPKNRDEGPLPFPAEAALRRD
jgi:hypothetical protein